MATILRTTFTQNTPGPLEAVVFVDSMNKDSFVAEMYNLCIRYIREKTDITNQGTLEFKREKFMAKNENEIYYDKSDGYWMISDEKLRVVTLYRRVTYRGRIYDSKYVEKLFTLTCQECPKIVPKVFKKSTMFENFTQELSEKVTTYRDRTNTLKA